jgi:hypothetical protein
VDRQRIARLITELDDRRFKVRDAAFKALEEIGLDAEPELRRLNEQELDPNLRRLVQVLLRKIDGRSLPPGQLQALRVIDAVERIGGDKGRQLLKALAAGDADAALTRDAKTALRRLGE